MRRRNPLLRAASAALRTFPAHVWGAALMYGAAAVVVALVLWR